MISVQAKRADRIDVKLMVIRPSELQHEGLAEIYLLNNNYKELCALTLGTLFWFYYFAMMLCELAHFVFHFKYCMRKL